MSIENIMFNNNNKQASSADFMKQLSENTTPDTLVKLAEMQQKVEGERWENARNHIQWLYETSTKYNIDVNELEKKFLGYITGSIFK